jgi:bifunctional non-homologous end joining protein LigD
MSERTEPSLPRAGRAGRVEIPTNQASAEVEAAPGQTVTLTNLTRIFWSDSGITKRDLLQYYADISPVLLPHLVNRAMVMKRYPDGANGKFFFQKRAPSPRPKWVPICEIRHPSANLVDVSASGERKPPPTQRSEAAFIFG